MPDVHAKRYGASTSSRWINCPGSIRLADQCPVPDGSKYAEEGTLAHSVAELKLKIATDRTVDAKELKHLTKDPLWDGEMDEATDFYRDTVIEHLSAAPDDAQLMIEQRVDYSEWAPGGFGTSDAVIVSDEALEIFDLKYGKGIRVDAEGNSQMRLYALGAYQIFGELYDFDTVRMTIIQPRLDHVSTEELDIAALLDWAELYVKTAVEAAESDNPPTSAGDWCRWCPAKAVCRKRADENLKLAQYDFADPDLLTPIEIADVLEKADRLSKWVADVQDYALQQALAGEHFDGWKLVEGRSVRKYTDELKVSEALQKAGFDEALLYERKLLGLTAMEKLVGKKKLAEVCDGLIDKPPGKPVLVPASDRRDELNTTASAVRDFT